MSITIQNYLNLFFRFFVCLFVLQKKEKKKKMLTLQKGILQYFKAVAFATAGPKLWKSLPLYIRLAPSVSIFKSSLKTFLFSLAFNSPWLLVAYFYSPVLHCISSPLYSTLVGLGCFEMCFINKYSIVLYCIVC